MINTQHMSITLPGRIVEYFKDTQLATIQISAESVFNNDSAEGDLIIRRPIENVPVHTPYGGGWSITFPILAGDTCLVVFSQVGYDHWLYEDKDRAGTIANLPNPDLLRSFSEDDGFAIVGFNTLPRAIQNYSSDGSQWRNQDVTQSIHLKEDLSIQIDSPVSVTINAPSLAVSCETADITASTSVTVDSPNTTMTGNLTVEGLVTGEGGLSVSGGTGATVEGDFNIVGGGDITTDGDVKAGVISLKGHIHTGNEGNPTSGPMPAPS